MRLLKMVSLFLFLLFCITPLHSQTINVTSPADSGDGSLRQAITDINAGSDASNTINLQIPGNSPITVSSDLPVIKKNTEIVSTGEQPINGQGQYRLFATIMADLNLTNCNLHNGAAIGGSGGGGGMGAGGGVYIDRGNTLNLINTTVVSCKAQGGQGGGGGGGGASFSSSNKNATRSGGGDYPGLADGTGGASDGSHFLTGYGGGDGSGDEAGAGGGNGAGSVSGVGGYCGGGGGNNVGFSKGGGGGNGGGNGSGKRPAGGGGFGSGGAVPLVSEGGLAGGGGGFGGGGGDAFRGGGGGFGGGGGGGGRDAAVAKGGRYGGNGKVGGFGGGGAGLGGAIFVGDTATCIIKDNVSISGNTVQGGAAGGGNAQPGQGYAPDIFLFREAEVVFDNQQPLAAPYSIMADQEAPAGHLDKGIIKQGPGQLTLSNPNNNYRGGTQLEGGTLSVTDPKALGSSSAPITLDGGTLQPTKTMTLSQPIAVNGDSGIDTPGNTTLTTTGDISGSGAIDKTGTGTWRETGTSTHTGDLNVNQGTLQVDGTLPSNININPGGTLQGSGIAGGNVTNSGTVKPSSDQLGTLTIGGNYTQNPDGLLQLQMKPNNLSDHFLIKGTAQLDGALELELEPGIYQKNQKYDLIQADGGLNGFFNQISTNSKVQGIIQVTPNNFNIIFDNPQIILPVQLNDLPYNQKNLSNYLFCDNFPFENNRLVYLLQNLFSLSPRNYIKALATLTPEHYGAIPIGEAKCLQYLLTQNPPTCEPDCPCTTQTIAILPLYIRNQHNKHNPSIPNYTQNTGGVRFQHTADHTTGFQTEAALSYLHTHTCWADRRGNSDSNGLYLDAGLGYNKNNFHFAFTILGAYSSLTATHNLFIGYPIKTKAKPHLWDLAEALTLQYTQNYNCIALIPRITLTQTNIFLSSITENKPKGLNLTTDSKTFSYLDTLATLRIQGQKTHCYCCVKPYLDLGYRNITHLTNREFTSKLDNYTACACNFKTETYKSSSNTFFMEWGIAFSHKNDMDILFNYRTEAGKGEFVQAINLGASWRF